MISKRRGIYLFMVVADCVPIIIFDYRTKVVALIHAGWRGTGLKIAEKAVSSLRSQFKSKSEDLIVGFGPAARKDSYIKKNPSQLGNPKWDGFIDKIPNLKDFAIDFVGLARKQLIDAGVKDENIYDCRIDTVKDKRFFSYFRDSKTKKGDQGRFACVLGIRRI